MCKFMRHKKSYMLLIINKIIKTTEVQALPPQIQTWFKRFCVCYSLSLRQDKKSRQLGLGG